jgi:hypothetical protein
MATAGGKCTAGFGATANRTPISSMTLQSFPLCRASVVHVAIISSKLSGGVCVQSSVGSTFTRNYPWKLATR